MLQPFRLFPRVLCAQLMMRGSKRGAETALVDLHRGSHVTLRGAAAVLRHVRDHGLPTAISESSQRRARQRIAAQSTTFGLVVQRPDLHQVDRGRLPCIFVSRPFALMHRTTRGASTSEDFD